jgi:hypothetical protein
MLRPANRWAARWLLIMCAWAPVLAGCSGGITEHRTGTITGRLVAEYGSKGILGGRIILNVFVPGRIQVLSDGKAVSTARADSDGSFSVRVPTGRYTVRGPATAAGPCTSTPRTLRVRLGKISHVQVFCPRAGRPK